MKTKILSLLVPALLVTAAAQGAEIYNKDANKLDLYGLVDGLHYFSDDKNSDGDHTYVRIGIKGETQISSQLTGYGQWQSQLNANIPESSNKFFTRVGFAGVRYANLGSLDYGRNYGLIYDIFSWTDMLPEFGGDTYGMDNFMQSRIGGALTYRTDNFFGMVDGLHVALQYQGKNNYEDPLRQNGDGFATSVWYDSPLGISVGGALSASARTAEQNALAYGKGDKAENYAAAIKYSAHHIYIAADYKQSYNASRFGNDKSEIKGFANKTENFEVVAQYQFEFGLVPSLAYLQSRGRDLGVYGTRDLLKYVEVGATYYFNKNMSAYVDYKINLLKENEFTEKSATSTKDIVALGLEYQF